ncbi:L,D-transpeptidase [Enterococcus sp. AZ072]|uniref:L,D-transpeptidase n=1 Tax=unclassified Enterococcus TaxID=2608891 RepID=UPI003D29BB4D
MYLSKNFIKKFLLLLLLSLLFLFIYFRSHFLPWAKVNTTSVGGLTIQQSQKKLEKTYQTVSISLTQNNTPILLTIGQPYKISEDFLKANLHHASTLLPLANRTMEQVTTQINAADFGIEIENQSALVSHKNQKFVIQPEKQGTQIDRQQLIKVLYQDMTVGSLKEVYQLTDFYVKPELTSENLKSTVRDLNQLLTEDRSLIIAKKKIPLSKNMIIASVNESGTLDSLLTTQLVQKLNQKYSTIDRPVDFVNVHGEHLRFKNVGNYGWYIDTEKAVKLLNKQLLDSKIESIELPLKGNPSKQPLHVKQNYIEVDLENQKMYCFHKGKKVVSTNVITGQFIKETATIPGFHTIMDKQKNTYLSGALITGDGSYRVPVNYWMPFLSYGQTITEIGIHDTEHKKEAFGDPEAFKTGFGSYGCINTPLNKVEKIYKYSYIGMPVFIYGHTYDYAPGEYDKPVDYGEEI